MNASNSERIKIIKRRNYPVDIQGDAISLYISNYNDAAEYLAHRIGHKEKVAVELCCGIGVTLEKLARVFRRVVGVEIDAQILKWCRENLTQADAINDVRLICGNTEDKELLRGIKADIAIYDIPYWDIGISQERHSSSENPKLKETIKNIRKLITKNIVICAPVHYTYEMAVIDLGPCEYQEIYRPTHKRNYIYLGQLIEKEGITKLEL
jgi:tRNA1(Val) A37 N6-methylase TrmN6